MKTDRAITHLEDIRDTYKEIHAISAAIDENSGAGEICDAVNRRRILLEKISFLQNSLEKEARGWRSRLSGAGIISDIVSQIKNILYAITEKDLELQAAANAQIDNIRRQLSSLTSTSKAALAYAGQKDALKPRYNYAD